MKTSRLIAFVLFGAVYVLGNIGGNYAGWGVILRWFEEANGAATVAPIWFHPVTLFVLALFPSGGQWYREWHSINDKWQWIIYLIMAGDLGINVVGFYSLAMGTFTFPPVWSVFLFLSIVAFIPNVLCQSLATVNLRVLLDNQTTRSNNKSSNRPALPPNRVLPTMLRKDTSAPRRSNGAIPTEVEELRL